MSGTSGKKPSKRARGSDKEELLRTLAERDRQLGELTEQAMGFLEELGELRRTAGEQNFAKRIEDLERSLADARRRLRGATACVLRTGALDEAPPSLEIVLWGPGSAEAALSLGEHAAGRFTTWVGRPDELPADAGKNDTVQWLTAAEARTPAQCWNLALQATGAPAILFLTGDCAPPETLTLPDGTGDPRVALAAPAFARGGAQTMGCDERGDFASLAPLPRPDGSEPVRVPYPEPEAFLVMRSAFEALGFFSEGLWGNLALVDFAHRAREHGYLVIGLPNFAIAASGEARNDPHRARDRLLVLAGERPHALGKALAEGAFLWQMPKPAAAPFFADLVLRLRGPQSEAVESEVLAAVASSMVELTVPMHQMEARVRAMGQESEVVKHLAEQLTAGLKENLRDAEEGRDKLRVQLVEEQHAQRQLLAERNRWIALLLEEVGKRRLFPRKLLDQERAFLEEMDGDR